MKELQTSLLREKFVIHGPSAASKPVVALSNRMEIRMTDDAGKFPETIALRAQNMHSCARMAAQLILSYNKDGRILARRTAYDWPAACDRAQSEYEQAYNSQKWIAAYNRGSCVFSQGPRHAFFDIIEKRHAEIQKSYEDSIPAAEALFRKESGGGRIDYDGNVALKVSLEKKSSRIGVIVRAPDKTRTFSYSMTPAEGEDLDFAQCIGSAAAFLEGIQLAFMVGMNEEKLRTGAMERHSKDERMTREARRRLDRLDAEITALERACEVRYRPERPGFQDVLFDAGQLAKSASAARA